LTRKTCAQSEPGIVSTVAARKVKLGIGANGLTQKNFLRSGRRACGSTQEWPVWIKPASIFELSIMLRSLDEAGAYLDIPWYAK